MGESFKRLEESLLRMGEVNAAADPRRAALLKKAVEESKKRDMDLQFTGIVDLLQKDQLSRALENQAELEQDLHALLQLLQSEDQAKRLDAEKKRIREYLKLINRPHQAAAGRPGTHQRRRRHETALRRTEGHYRKDRQARRRHEGRRGRQGRSQAGRQGDGKRKG